MRYFNKDDINSNMAIEDLNDAKLFFEHVRNANQFLYDAKAPSDIANFYQNKINECNSILDQINLFISNKN